jgi:hypothetical protein
MVVETLQDHAVLAAVAALVLRAILAWQSDLSYYEYRTLHGLKPLAARLLGRDTIGPISIVNRKGGRDDPEFLTDLADAPRDVVRDLRQRGFALHLLASAKARPDGPAVAQLSYQHDDDTQTEVYLFRADDGGTAVYSHHETSAGTLRHLTDTDQTPGDPRGVVPYRRGD